jgi:hypothetical protein
VAYSTYEPVHEKSPRSGKGDFCRDVVTAVLDLSLKWKSFFVDRKFCLGCAHQIDLKYVA